MLRLLLLASALGAAEPDLRIRPAPGGEFRFDTGVLAGTLRAGGKSRGLADVVHRPTGATLTQARLSFGLLSIYRVFAGGERFGPAAWDWPGAGTALADGSLETRWPEAAARPFELAARYRWSAPAQMDMTVTVRAAQELPDFEVFVASYFAPEFDPAVVRTAEGFLPADVSGGEWQIFPRDRGALGLIRGGRWLLPPNPVEWSVRPRLSGALAYRLDRGRKLAAILMAPPRDCFAVAAPQTGDVHYSTYLSLFGRTIRAGETAQARVRLVVAVDDSEASIVHRYEAYLAGPPR